ncbi:flavin reductase family protein [Salinibacterium sp. ZJ454]|uniref:flavin reductase family protein n=1 Tax=Salinibacterium sp. ZJ454 TaxID=2708339 RepID=UPI00141DC757|nr:flavin reductase family protein [Salinibacterium sp. ZJ454]
MEVSTVDPLHFREVLGNWPSGVVVITTTVDGEPVGMAMNSFSSVSLDPALVGFFPAKSSSTWPGMRRAGRFCVNVLASHHEAISRSFARKGINRFDGVAWHDGLAGPCLEEAVAWIECELFDEVDTGDHTLVLGRVLQIDAAGDGQPLVFHRGRYLGLHAPQL